ncbi:MAG: hypothetical protein IPJ79_00935 [Bacteroidetes bacterium]|nr:hypothetical protein [Bacteroidota bacterium]
MKLQLKLAIYNALSKALIVLVFGAVLPMIVERVVYNHTDNKLYARTEKVLKLLSAEALMIFRVKVIVLLKVLIF